MRLTTALAPFTVAVVLATSACAASSGGGAAGSSSCEPGKLSTHSSGRITVATDTPAYEPWFVDDKPANGKGFESAVAFAVAEKLGYPASKVSWTNATFNTVIAPTPKSFDFDINEVSITSARAKAVDFSSGYYDVAQAIVTLKSSRIAGVTTIAGLRGAKLGAQQGTTSYTAIKDVIKPKGTPSEYPTNDLAVQALKNGQIDGLVVDLPTGNYLTSQELTDATIVGKLPEPSKPEQFGLVLGKDSALTTCVSNAVDALRADGTLAALQKKWLTADAAVKVLK